MAVIRRHKSEITVEPLNDPVNKGYTNLLHFRCLECRQFNILQFHGAGIYKCKCGKEFYIRRER